MRKFKHLPLVMLSALLLSAVLLVTGCDGGSKTDETEAPTISATEAVTDPDTESETQSESESETETETETETESATEPLPEESLNVGEPTMDAEFALSEIYHVEPTQRGGEKNVSVSGVNLTFNYQSTFYGSDSVIDRDTYHYGHLFFVNLLSASTKNLKNSEGDYRKFVMGDFVGDRKDEFVMYDDGTLTIAAMNKNRDVKHIVFTQSLGIDATIVGAGLFNGDLYADIVLYTAGGQVLVGYGSNAGFEWTLIGRLPDRTNLSEGQTLYTGDVNGDGKAELVLIDDLTVTTYLVTDGTITHFATSTLPYAEAGQFLMYAVGDINSDNVDDILCIMPDGTLEGGEEYHAVRTYFGRRDGHFGPYESEGNNMNLYATYKNNPATEKVYQYEYLTIGDADGDGVDDYVSACMMHTGKNSRRNIYYGMHIGEMAAAYDYSTHFIRTDNGYILYNGGVWQTYDTENYTPGGGDHILSYVSEDGVTWYRTLDAACVPTATELGVKGDYSWGDIDPETGLRIPGTGDSFSSDKWWILNTIEPEVIRDPETGIYYMFTQTENYCFLEDGVTPMGADRIGIATSTDGIHFERKTDSPVIVNHDIYSAFSHQHVIYVPDDPDGKNWWMYVRYYYKNDDRNFDGSFVKYIRLRSDDPTCFDMAEGYDDLTGFGSHGNQMGYISDYDGQGNRLFVAIVPTLTATPDVNGNLAWPTAPTLIVSTDGINWVETGISLASVDLTNEDEGTRANMYFLGMSTMYGTGEIYKNENGEYEFIYGGCCSPSPIAPGIFASEVGGGIATFTIEIAS